MKNTQPRAQLAQESAHTTSLAPEGEEPGATARSTDGLPASTELPPGLADHPRYRVVRLLGRGGMGAVYLAEHRLMNRSVALKVISRSLTERPATVERFRQEVRAAARLDHPNIVHAYDAEQAGDSHFLVMEYVEGTDLARLVQQRGPLPVALACHFVRQAALGLQHAFEHGMVHRDIKPHNLMVTRRGRVKILDFGLARFASEAGGGGPLTQSGAVLGTPDYIAPEQALDAHAADVRADLYSLGCTLYYLLTGRVPFPGESLTQKLLAHQLSQPEPLGKLRPELPPGLVALVERLMAKKPEDRYQTPAEVAQALAPYVRRGPAARATAAAASSPPAEERFRPTQDRAVERVPAARRGPAAWRWVAAVAVTAVCLGVLSLLAGVAVYRIQTDKGELVIETDDPDVEVIVKQNGQQVTIVDAKTGQKAELHAGTYELALSGKPNGLRLSTDRLALKRGDRKIVEVRRQPVAEAPAARPASAAEIGEIRQFAVFAPHHVAFSPDGKYALCGQGTGDQGKIVSLWDLETGKEVRRFLGHEAPVATSAFPGTAGWRSPARNTAPYACGTWPRAGSGSGSRAIWPP